MKKKIKNISGVTLIEILIGVVISVVMMAAMFTSYNVVNSTYSQVTDTAKISQAGRETLGMIMRDVRLAGYKYFGDDIPYDPKEHIPILITKQSLTNPCDKIQIVYGDLKSKNTTPPTFDFVRYRITYQCAEDRRIDPKGNGSQTYFDTEKLKVLQKQKEIWKKGNPGSFVVDTNNYPETYPAETVVQYVQDLIFAPIDQKGKKIDPPPSSTNNNDKVNSIKVVDVLLSVRSKNEFFRNKKPRIKQSLGDTGRNIGANYNDRFKRETILISAHARNLGL